MAKPLGSATLAVGTAVPHWLLLLTVGAVGKANAVASADAVIGQPLVMVAVQVYVVVPLTIVVTGLVVPITELPSFHE